MTPTHATPASEDWFQAIAAAFTTETPPHRRMVQPLRQHVDFQFVQPTHTTAPDPVSPAYNRVGRTASETTRPGRLLNVRV